MLTYINENFLHAPSTDLSREVIHLLIGITMAQATEIFTETLVEGKKSPALVCRSANQAASMYAALVDEMKEFQGKGIFDRNWLYILQIKAKLFASLAQYYRSTADSAAGKHGAALVRMRMADTFAQDAQRQASTFTYTFISQSTPSLPHDAHTSLHEITKAHASLCAEAKVQATKDNDLIYHEILPSEAALPQIDKLPPAAPITIQDVYGNPDVSKLIGPDIFIRLVPLAVHESASVYSEEKAKLVRAEVERSELNEGELRAGLEHLGLPSIVSTWRKMSDDDESGQADIEISSALSRLSAEVISSGPVDNLLRDVEAEREKCERDLRELNSLLDSENRDCERMRVGLSWIDRSIEADLRRNTLPSLPSRLRALKQPTFARPYKVIWVRYLPPHLPTVMLLSFGRVSRRISPYFRWARRRCIGWRRRLRRADRALNRSIPQSAFWIFRTTRLRDSRAWTRTKRKL